MKVSQAQVLYLSQQLVSAEIMRNPSNLHEWFVLVREEAAKSHLLADEEGTTIKSADLEAVFALLQSVGFKQALIHF